MRNPVLILFTFGVALAMAAPLLSQQSGSSGSAPQVDQNETTVTGTVPPEPTGKHKLNSTLYSDRRTYRNLIDRATKEKSIDMNVGVGMPFFPYPYTPPPSLATFLRRQVCSSDAVVVGHVIGKESYLTENKDWVFTDYDFVVDEAFKSPDAQIQPGSQITVTRTGGELLIYGHPIKAAESMYAPFQLRDTYVLFLKFMPASGSYQAAEEGSSYKVDSGKISKLTRGTLIPELNRPVDWQTFQNEIRISAANTCDSATGDSKTTCNDDSNDSQLHFSPLRPLWLTPFPQTEQNKPKILLPCHRHLAFTPYMLLDVLRGRWLCLHGCYLVS